MIEKYEFWVLKDYFILVCCVLGVFLIFYQARDQKVLLKVMLKLLIKMLRIILSKHIFRTQNIQK